MSTTGVSVLALIGSAALICGSFLQILDERMWALNRLLLLGVASLAFYTVVLG